MVKVNTGIQKTLTKTQLLLQLKETILLELYQQIIQKNHDNKQNKLANPDE